MKVMNQEHETRSSPNLQKKAIWKKLPSRREKEKLKAFDPNMRKKKTSSWNADQRMVWELCGYQRRSSFSFTKNSQNSPIAHRKKGNNIASLCRRETIFIHYAAGGATVSRQVDTTKSRHGVMFQGTTCPLRQVFTGRQLKRQRRRMMALKDPSRGQLASDARDWVCCGSAYWSVHSPRWHPSLTIAHEFYWWGCLDGWPWSTRASEK